MKLKTGQVWVDSRRPSLAYKITVVDYETIDCRSCVCELWFREETENKLNYVSNDYSVITYQNEFPYWTMIYDLGCF